MNDIIFLAVTLAIFALLALLTGLLDRTLDDRTLGDRQPDGEQ